jgi:hypothetical protein
VSERCDLSELDPSSCAHCRDRDAMTWPARYEGICRVCETVIDIGATVRWTADGGHVQHAHHR